MVLANIADYSRDATVRSDRVTATESINGIEHLVVLERLHTGRYREVSVTPLRPRCIRWSDPSMFLG